ncbi:hypothetical protein ABH924_004348 [Arthrobacter sp. GAS37]|uniref:hypothetical protein n=1 Tax=Arthrobacter sp. GAS37 TaxID=3156261 RepID=UPI00383901C7
MKHTILKTVTATAAPVVGGRTPAVRLFALAPAALLVLAALAGCAATPPSPPTQTASSMAASSPAVSATASATASRPGGSINEKSPQAPAESSVPAPATDAAAKDAAKAAAVQVMILYARPYLDPGRWLDELRPVATAGFIKENASVNPRFVGASSVRGAGDWVMDPGNLYTVQVPVTTDGGVFIVQLHRNGATAPWLVRYVIPPTLRSLQ